MSCSWLWNSEENLMEDTRFSAYWYHRIYYAESDNL